MVQCESNNSSKQLIACVAVCVACVLIITAIGGYSTVIASKKRVPVYSVQRSDNVVGLSFDAAWGADKTRAIMDLCDSYNVKATFFLVGFWIDKYPDMVREMHERHFEIGVHSLTHPKMSTLSAEEMRVELVGCMEKIRNITGVTPTLFRPPFGDYNNTLLDVADSVGLCTIQWSVDSLDWKGLSAEEITKRVQKAQSGDIILCHNNSDHITEALPLMLEWMKIKNLCPKPIGAVVWQDNYIINSQGVQISNADK